MATIIEDNSSNEGAMKMSSEFTFSDGQAEYVLSSGSTGYTCYGTFSAPGVPDGTKLSFPENGSQLGINTESGRQLDTNMGVSVFCKDTVMSEKGYLTMIFTYQNKAQGQIVATFVASTEKSQELLALPEFQGAGWAGWSPPA